MSKIRLNVLGLSYSQTQAGAYALVLAEENGKRRIPIIIGGFEAQSIAIVLEKLSPPRPLTHDLFHTFAKNINVEIKEVVISKLEEGVFYADIVYSFNNKIITIDARTSDAVALALRFKCPIYTSEIIMAKAGVVLDVGKEIDEEKEIITTQEENDSDSDNDFSGYNNKKLKEKLNKAISEENYELASKIRDEINLRK